MIVQQIRDLEMRPGGMPPVVHVSQYDILESGLRFKLLADGRPFTTEVDSVTVQGTKADKKGFAYDARLDVFRSGGVITDEFVVIDLVEQITAFPGPVYCDIAVKKNDDICYTAAFVLMVKPAGLASDVDISDTDLPIYIDGAQQAAAQAAQSANLAAQSALAAGNDASAADTSAEQAHDDALLAQSAASNASSYAQQAAASVAQGTQVDFYVQDGHLYLVKTIGGVEQPPQDLGSVGGTEATIKRKYAGKVISSIGPNVTADIFVNIAGHVTQMMFKIQNTGSSDVTIAANVSKKILDTADNKEQVASLSGFAYPHMNAKVMSFSSPETGSFQTLEGYVFYHDYTSFGTFNLVFQDNVTIQRGLTYWIVFEFVNAS